MNEIAGLDCKQTALEMGIDIILPVDIDEHIVPNNRKLSLMDDIAHWLSVTKKRMFPLKKLNYSPSQHFHKPIHLLTIEAY